MDRYGGAVASEHAVAASLLKSIVAGLEGFDEKSYWELMRRISELDRRASRYRRRYQEELESAKALGVIGGILTLILWFTPAAIIGLGLLAWAFIKWSNAMWHRERYESTVAELRRVEGRLAGLEKARQRIASGMDRFSRQYCGRIRLIVLGLASQASAAFNTATLLARSGDTEELGEAIERAEKSLHELTGLLHSLHRLYRLGAAVRLVSEKHAACYRRIGIVVEDPVVKKLYSYLVSPESEELMEAINSLYASLASGRRIPAKNVAPEAVLRKYGDVPLAREMIRLYTELERMASRPAEQAPQPLVEPRTATVFLIGRSLSVEAVEKKATPLPRPFRFHGYDVRALLGLGGYAATFLAVDGLGRSRVLKLPREAYETILYGVTYAPSREEAEAFLREYRSLERLRHPHIVSMIEGGVHNGVPYLVLEYCEHGSIRDYLRVKGPLPLREAVLMALQVADALSYMHDRGVVHRDLKPENILLTRDNIVKITDFNISKLMRTVSATSRSRPGFTAGYAAPEQIYSDLGETGPWTDVWSLGIILYEAVTGEKPYSPMDYEDEVKKPPRLERAPPEIRRVLEKMLVLEPEARASAAEVRDELAAVYLEITG